MLFFLVSCKTETKNLISLKAFSTFSYRVSHNDWKLFSFTWQFASDSVIMLQTDSTFKFTYSKTEMSTSLRDTLRTLFTKMEFGSLINNKTYAGHDFLYCGNDYGFIDSSGNAVAFIPNNIKPIQKTSLRELEKILFSLNGAATKDTLAVYNSFSQILKAYSKAGAPPPPRMNTTIKFKPPVINVKTK